jgi:hypothetical protein
MKKRTYHDEIRRKVYECNDSCDAHSTRVSIAKISCVGHEPRLTGVLFSGLVELSAIFGEKALIAKVDDGVYLSRLISVEWKRSSFKSVPWTSCRTRDSIALSSSIGTPRGF